VNPKSLITFLGQKLTASGKAAVPRLIPEPTDSGYAESFDGTRIYWELHGPREGARPMVFCYGLVCSMNQWRAQLARYSLHHPCLLVDYRGHHKSGSPQDARLMNISAIARDVAAALRAQNFSQAAHVWGHSMGVNVAIELAALEPRTCQSLVLCCGTEENPFRSMFGTDALDKIAETLLKIYPDNPELFHAVGRVVLGHAKLTRMVAQIAGFNDQASTSAADMDAYAQAVAAINPRTFFPLLIELSKGLTQAIVPKIKTPALVIAGAKDYVTPPASQKRLSEHLPRSRYVEIPLGSHNVQLDFGEYVCLKAEEFWKEEQLE
jgi:pimeloyl-ACP methyl ester carboxylesterase